MDLSLLLVYIVHIDCIGFLINHTKLEKEAFSIPQCASKSSSLFFISILEDLRKRTQNVYNLSDIYTFLPLLLFSN